MTEPLDLAAIRSFMDDDQLGKGIFTTENAALIVAAVNALPALLSEIESLRVAINGFRWLGNNLHNANTPAFRDYFLAALEDARLALGDDWQPMRLAATEPAEREAE